MREYSSLEIPSGFLVADFFGWEDVEADGIDRMLRTSAAEGPDMLPVLRVSYDEIY
jgi:hypothetical protein